MLNTHFCRKSGSGTDEIYCPKLTWFNSPNFFREVLSTRHSQSNLLLLPILLTVSRLFMCSLHSPGIILPLLKSSWSTACGVYIILTNLSSNEVESNPIEEIENEGSARGSINDIQIDETIIGRPRPSPTKMKPPSGSVKKIKKQTAPDIAIYVAYELRQLPQRHAILLQSEIQSCITRIRLSTLEPLPHQYHQQPLPYTEQLHVNVASPSTSSSSISNYTSTPHVNEEYDIISQAIINSFSDNDQ
ncbi:hypothetical protein QTP88_012711 [Uroleucon formosanum]